MYVVIDVDSHTTAREQAGHHLFLGVLSDTRTLNPQSSLIVIQTTNVNNAGEFAGLILAGSGFLSVSILIARFS